MNLFQFLDIKYQETSIELGREYSVFKDGRAKAIHAVIGFYRAVSKWVSVPVVLIEFILMKTKVIDEPVSPIKQPKLQKQAPVVVEITTTGNETK